MSAIAVAGKEHRAAKTPFLHPGTAIRRGGPRRDLSGRPGPNPPAALDTIRPFRPVPSRPLSLLPLPSSPDLLSVRAPPDSDPMIPGIIW